MSFYLGIDVGTTAVKVIAADNQGTVIAVSGQEYGYSQPRQGWAEQDPEDWWQCIRAVVRQVAASLPEPPTALALSTQGDTMCPIDADGHPMLPARLWLDTRTHRQVEALLQKIPETRWKAITGTGLSPCLAAATLAWWADEHPDTFAQAWRFCLVQDYLIGRMTGTYMVDASNASRTAIFDIAKRAWSDELMRTLNVEENRLAKVSESGTPVGNLTAQAAEELGLQQETLVVLGAHDQTAGAVGCGAVEPGMVMLATGTAWVELGAAAEFHVDTDASLQTYCHAVPGGVAVLGAHAGGSLLRWARDNFSQSTDKPAEDYNQLVAEAQAAEKAGHTPLVFLPHFYGAGMPYGRNHALGAWLGLTLQHTRGDMLLALMRGVATHTAAVFDAMSNMGYTVNEIRMIGGGARSDMWAQLVADAFQRPVALPVITEAAAFGAAMLAAIGAGAIASVHDVAEMVTVNRVIEPREGATVIYPGVHADFLDALGNTWQGLSKYRQKH